MVRRADICGRGHDLADEKNFFVDDTGHKRCRACKRADEARRRSRQRLEASPVFTTCSRCGLSKYGDSRRLCFQCSFQQRPVDRVQEAMRVDDDLSQAVQMESAMPWDREAYLAQRRARDGRGVEPPARRRQPADGQSGE